MDCEERRLFCSRFATSTCSAKKQPQGVVGQTPHLVTTTVCLSNQISSSVDRGAADAKAYAGFGRKAGNDTDDVNRLVSRMQEQ